MKIKNEENRDFGDQKNNYLSESNSEEDSKEMVEDTEN